MNLSSVSSSDCSASKWVSSLSSLVFWSRGLEWEELDEPTAKKEKKHIKYVCQLSHKLGRVNIIVIVMQLWA